MRLIPTRRSLLVAVLALHAPIAGLGCSADAIDPPEPDVTTPGAFVAMDADEQGILLFHTQGSTGLGMGDRILLVDIYQAAPSSFAEARELAKDPALPLRTKDYFITHKTIVSAPHEVVWFRSLAP